MRAIVIVAIPFSGYFLWHHYTHTEPPFAVMGDKDILNKLHINVYMYREKGKSTLETAFLNGRPYPTNNRNVVENVTYINYDNKLFTASTYPVTHSDNSDIGLTDHIILLFCKSGQDIFASYHSTSDLYYSTKCDEANIRDNGKLVPLKDITKSGLLDESDFNTVSIPSQRMAR
jgi:hypothetical protein